jgi:hypothetical protein
MIKKIIDGICLALSSKFGEREIYTEAVNQGLEDGSFSIVCLNPTNAQFLGNRYFRTNQFCIHYFPKTNEPKSECLEVLEGLYEALETIGFDGDLIRGTNMTSEMDEGVLHFFVNYDFFTIHKMDEPFMEHFDHSSNVKG